MLDKLVNLNRKREFPWERLASMDYDPAKKARIRAAFETQTIASAGIFSFTLQQARTVRDYRRDWSWDVVYQERANLIAFFSLSGPYHGPDPTNLQFVEVIRHMSEMLGLEAIDHDEMLKPITAVRLGERAEAIEKIWSAKRRAREKK